MSWHKAHDLWTGSIDINIKPFVERATSLGIDVLASNQHLSGLVSSSVAPAGTPGTLRRLTYTLQDAKETHVLTGSFGGFKDFDILAVRPTTDKILATCAEKLEVDLISMDLSKKLPFRFRLQTLRQAVERGVLFEIVYGPLLTGNEEQQRNVIANAQELVRLLKGRHLVLSSGAQHPLDMRGPLDIVAISRLFGMSRDQAMESITTNARMVVLKGIQRTQTYKGVVSVKLLPSTSSAGAHANERDDADEHSRAHESS